MTEGQAVVVICEVTNGNLSSSAAEGLGIGQQLASSLSQDLSAVLIGSGVESFADEAIHLGASKVYVVDDVALEDYLVETYLRILTRVAKEAQASVLIMGQTTQGRELAPRLAFQLGTVATLDCVEIGVDPSCGRLLLTKPVYGGNARAVFTSDTFPQVVTMRAKAIGAAEPDASRKGTVIRVETGSATADTRTRVIERVVAEEVEGIRLEDAKIIVTGGRGIGGPDGFKQLEGLAKLLEGATGASRPACDNGWVPTTMQIGLTGKIVAPEVYIAVAVSGSSQHMSGCSGSKNIIAINKDPEANIFKNARFGVVGDWRKVVPAFASAVKELLAR